MVDTKIGFKVFSNHHTTHLLHLKKPSISFKQFLIMSLIAFLELFAITSIFSFGIFQILSALKK